MERTLQAMAFAVLLFPILAFEVNAEEKGSTMSSEVKKEVREAVEDAKEYTIEQKRLYAKKIEEQLNTLGKEIDQLENKARKAKKEVSESLRGTIEDLKAKQNTAQQRLVELKSATSSAWNNLKTGLDKAMGDLSNAYDNAKQQFK